MSSQRRLDATSGGRPIHARILVVDGNRDAADSTVMLLRLWGYDVCAAYTGPDALDIADRFHPHIILSEILLPLLDGYECARRLHRAAPAAALVALTTVSGPADRQRGREAGFRFHLVKPADPDELLETLVRAAYQAPPAGAVWAPSL